MNYRPEAALNENRSVLSERNPYKHSKVQDGFVTFGLAQVVDWLGRVTTAALKAAWVQKWLVHRRLRPEAFAGRIHQTKTKTVEYPIHADILDSAAVEETYGRWDSYLLPQAYPEGSPIHPSYPGGHATVAGACSVVLKSLFDERGLMPDCVHASPHGSVANSRTRTRPSFLSGSWEFRRRSRQACCWPWCSSGPYGK